MFDGLSLLVAVGALASAVVALRQTMKLVAIEVERDDLRAQERAAEQARTVTGWIAEKLVDAEPRVESVGAYLCNRSDNAIYDVHLEAVVKQRDVATHLLVLPPGDHFLRLGFNGTFGFPTPPDVGGTHYRAFTKTLDYRVRSLTFRDAAGAVWRRDEGGVLEPVAPAPSGRRPTAEPDGGRRGG